VVMVVSGWRIGWLSRNSTLRGSGQQAVRCRARLEPNPAADPLAWITTSASDADSGVANADGDGRAACGRDDSDVSSRA